VRPATNPQALIFALLFLAAGTPFFYAGQRRIIIKEFSPAFSPATRARGNLEGDPERTENQNLSNTPKTVCASCATVFLFSSISEAQL